MEGDSSGLAEVCVVRLLAEDGADVGAGEPLIEVQEA